MNVCGAPTRFVASGVIAIFASTHLFVAGPEFAPAPSVLRVSETPATASVVCALTVVTPVTAELRLIVQEPVPPDVVHGFAEVNAPGPLSIVKLICVPSGAFTKPAAVVHVHMRRERVRLTDPVHAVRRDLDVRVDDLQRLAGTVGRKVGRVALVVRPERAEARPCSP